MASGNGDDLKLPTVITQGITQYDVTVCNGSGPDSESDPCSGSESDTNPIITTDGSVSFEGGATASTLTAPEAIHPCYEVLLGRKKQVGLKASRIEIIIDLLEMNKSTYIPSMLKNDPFITEWFFTYNVHANNPSTWNVKIIAKAICHFDDIVQKIARTVARTPDQLPPNIILFQTYMEGVREAAELLKTEVGRVRKGKIGVQKGGLRIQDSMQLKDISPTGFDTENCASCRHHYLLPVGKDLNEIHRHNNNCRKDHLTKMIKWNNLPVKRKGSKPKSGRHLSQQLACLCTKMHCTNSLNGQGCFKCVELCTQARDAGSLSRPLFDDKLRCTCDICRCQCSVLYFRHDAAKLAIQAQTEREERRNSMSQTNLNAFLGLKSTIVDMTQDTMEENDALSLDDAMAITACDIMKNKKMQEDVKKRLELQRSMGPLTTYVEGKSIAQLRTEKKRRRMISPHKAHCHLPIRNEAERIITPSAKKGRIDNCRWYNNNLHEADESCSPVDRKLAFEPKSKNLEIDKSVILEKAVMRRLVDNSSPSSDDKKTIFHKMVKKDDAVKAIISIASDMDASVDDTKKMLMDNCL